MEYTLGTGRRKTSVARVYLQPGSGKVTVNNKDYTEFFDILPYRNKVDEPFRVTGTEGQYDVKVNVHGGGVSSQAESIRHAISRALVNDNEEFKKPLKDEGYLTRDDRMVERKKSGLKKARKRSQYRKR